MLRRTLSLACLFIGTTLTALASPIYFLKTDITGAQTQIDTNHTSTWLLTPNTPFDLGGGLFEMKDGPSTAADVVLSLYQGSNNAGTLLGQVILTNTAFCAQVANCQAFNTHSFLFTSPIALSAGTTYFAALTSVAPDTQSTAYFIKAQRSFMLTGTAIRSPPIRSVAPPSPNPVRLFSPALVWWCSACGAIAAGLSPSFVPRDLQTTRKGHPAKARRPVFVFPVCLSH